MIISQKHKFCFFQIPRTGSTAIAKALIDHYDSEQIFQKHSSYEEYLGYAENNGIDYFKFAGIRNPLDSFVSQYFKIKNDHKGNYSRGTFRAGKPVAKATLEKYHFIQKNNATFEDYFLEYNNNKYFKPHQENTLDNMDFIIRFDHLQEDFNRVTNLLNLPHYVIPIVNQTNNRERNFESYFTPKIIPLAIDSFGPFMKKYNFTFPKEWL